jgi:exodeoxyribonuclease VII small subunit
MSEQELYSSSFNKNYRILKETADWLSTQEEPDIDQLVPRVDLAMKAYRICKDRLERVKETLGQCLQEDGSPTGDDRPGVDGAVRPRRSRLPGRDGDGDGSMF